MRTESATTPPCPPPGIAPDRPAVWSEVRNILYPALRQLGLAQEAATTAAERGADAALVEARLVTLAEAQRWGRPFTGGVGEDQHHRNGGADTSEPDDEAAMGVEMDIGDIGTLATVATLALGTIDLTRSTHQAAALRLLSGLTETARRLVENWDAAFAKRGRAPRNTDQEGRS